VNGEGQVRAATAVSRRTLLTLAVVAGIGAANLYYNQPLLAQMSAGLHASRAAVGVVPVLTQAGYACGLLLIVPMSDVLDPRRLMGWMAIQTGVALVGIAVAPNVLWLQIASFLLGCSTVLPQLSVPTAVRFSPPAQRGSAVGVVMRGLLIGVILSRAYAGLLAPVVSWRGVYWIAAGFMVASALGIWRSLPAGQRHGRVAFWPVLRSLPSIARADPILREATVLSGLVFGGLSCFWAALVFYVEKPPYSAGPRMVGLLALVGASGAIAAPRIGRLAGERATWLIAAAISSCVVGFILLGVVGSALAGLIVGTFLLDGGCQINEVSNLVRIFSHRDVEQGRANTVFMVGLFAGGAAGSALADWSWGVAGWTGVCASGSALCLLALAILALQTTRRPETCRGVQRPASFGEPS
jgi:predicted MFS family arabinose efflux permease